MGSSDFGLLKEMFTRYRIYIGSEFGYIFPTYISLKKIKKTMLKTIIFPSEIGKS